jgi:hypothetical protein
MKICDYCGRQNEDEAIKCCECGTQEFKISAAETNIPAESPTHGWKFKELTPQEMQMDLVTLFRCRTLTEADMIVSQLHSAGIFALIPDEFLSQAVSWNLNTYGYVRVQVSPKDYESAKEFLLASPGQAEPGAAPTSGTMSASGDSETTECPPSAN